MIYFTQVIDTKNFDIGAILRWFYDRIIAILKYQTKIWEFMQKPLIEIDSGKVMETNLNIAETIWEGGGDIIYSFFYTIISGVSNWVNPGSMYTWEQTKEMMEQGFSAQRAMIESGAYQVLEITPLFFFTTTGILMLIGIWLTNSLIRGK